MASGEVQSRRSSPRAYCSSDSGSKSYHRRQGSSCLSSPASSTSPSGMLIGEAQGFSAIGYGDQGSPLTVGFVPSDSVGYEENADGVGSPFPLSASSKISDCLGSGEEIYDTNVCADRPGELCDNIEEIHPNGSPSPSLASAIASASLLDSNVTASNSVGYGREICDPQKSPDFSYNVEVHFLNPDIWGRLPPEILEHIITCLPVTSILRFRTVCRRWNRLPFNKKFPKIHTDEVGVCPPFLSPQCDILYIDGSGKWWTIPFHFFPSKHVILEASGGGLLLFSKSNRTTRLVEAFYVCNPITKQWCELTGFSIRSTCAACIDVNPSALDFKVIIAGWMDRADRYTGLFPVIEVFDSSINTWVRRANIQDYDFYVLRGLVLSHGSLYMAIQSRNLANLKVVSLNLDGGGVTEIFEGFGGHTKFHCFGQYHGNLTVVTQQRGVRIIEIWQHLIHKNGDCMWFILDRLAQEKLNAFSTAAVAGDFVFFNYVDEPIALYDLRDKSWRWVDFPSGRKYWLGMRPLAFEPSFVPLE